jgi:glycosyltransferase involved in cell wall biosynthesis
MPMLDGAWERGKCGFKLVQYMAAARPAVASPLGAGPSIVIPGETGFLAHDVREWTAALARLAADRELTRKLGLLARQRAENVYSLQVNAPKLVAALRNALEPTLP